MSTVCRANDFDLEKFNGLRNFFYKDEVTTFVYKHNEKPRKIREAEVIIKKQPHRAKCSKAKKLCSEDIFRETIDIISFKSVNPYQYRFEPKEDWTNVNLAFNSLKVAYFAKRLGKKSLFQYKLWNALQITKYRYDLYQEVGVIWISQNIIKMNRQIFGALLNLSKPKQSLFAKRGSMMTHGFVEIMKEDAKEKYNLYDYLIDDVDGIKVKLYYHKNNEFGLVRAPTLETCKWVSMTE